MMGVMLYCMLFGEYPYYGDDENDLIKNIIQEPVRYPDVEITDQAFSLLK
jgi:hypothetical protein